MPQQTEAPTRELAEAIEIIAENAGWSVQDLVLILDSCGDCLEGDRVLTEVAKYKHAKFSGWITLNLKDGNVTELRVNPDVRGGLVMSPRYRWPAYRRGLLLARSD
jgi:hypothetical protein